MRHDGATAGAGGAIEWPRGSFFQVLYTLRLAAGEMENLSDVKLWLLVVANPSQCFNVCGLKYFETIICLFTPAAFFLHTGSFWGPCRCQTPAAPKLLEGHWVAHTTNLRMSTLTIYRAPYPTELQEFNVSQPPRVQRVPAASAVPDICFAQACACVSKGAAACPEIRGGSARPSAAVAEAWSMARLEPHLDVKWCKYEYIYI